MASMFEFIIAVFIGQFRPKMNKIYHNMT